MKITRDGFILKIIFKLLFISCLAIPLAACGGEKIIHWQQQVQLQDGRMIVVNRVSKRSDPVFPENANGLELEQTLTFANPDTNEKITWTLPKGLHPYALDFDKKIPYLVFSAYTVADYNDWNCPNPPFLVYRYENKAWHAIAFNQLPEKMTIRNIMDMSKSITDVSNDDFITPEEHAKWLLRMIEDYRIISRKKVHPIAKGCEPSVLFKQGRKSEINVPYVE